MVDVSDEDEHFELIEAGISVPKSCWPHSFVVSCMKTYKNWGHVSRFMSGLLTLVCLDLFLGGRHGFLFAVRPPPFDLFGELDAMDILEVEFQF